MSCQRPVAAIAATRAVGRHRVHGQPGRRSLLRSARAHRARATRLDDLSASPASGISALRYPVLWERVAPDGLDAAGLALDRRAPGAAARARHRARSSASSTTAAARAYTHAARSGTSRSSSPRYAAAVAERYPWVDDYTPVNEPLTTARFSGLYGHWYPHARDDATFVRALLNQCRAIVLAMRADPRGQPGGAAGPDRGLRARRSARRRWRTRRASRTSAAGWRGICCPAASTAGHPLWRYLRARRGRRASSSWFLDDPCPPDVVGLNYYVTSDRFLDERLERYPGVDRTAATAATRTPTSKRCGPAAAHRRASRPSWTRPGSATACRSRSPRCISAARARSSCAGCSRPGTRRTARDARGVDVRAVTAWALLGPIDWDSLVTEPTGHYEPGAFDVRGPEPRADRARGAARAIWQRAGSSTQPVFDSPGWWRRRGRLWVVPQRDTYPQGFPPKTSSMRYAPRAPRGTILITGGGGTLATAFARICARTRPAL